LRHDDGEAVGEPGRHGSRVPAPHGRSHGRLLPVACSGGGGGWLLVLLRSGGGGGGTAARAPHGPAL